MAAPLVDLERSQKRLWIESNRLGTEMRIESQGRRLFPVLNYWVNVDPTKTYLATLQFKNTATGEESSMTFEVKTGKELLNKPLSFAGLKITNDESEESKTQIMLEKDTEYVPIMRLCEKTDNGFIPVCETMLDYTKFKTVSTYSKHIRDFRKDHNPSSIARARGWESWRNWMMPRPSTRRRNRS